jgi:hypothetical protein
MRRLLASLTLAILSLFVAAGSAGATHSGGLGPSQDLTVGSGAVVFGPIFVELHVNAKSGASGEDPRGNLVFRGNPPPFGAIDIHGRITCLAVLGNQATVGFEVTKSRAGFPEGSGGLFSILDGGEPGTLDRFEGFPTGPPPTFCPLFEPTRTVTQGNFVVHDATP